MTQPPEGGKNRRSGTYMKRRILALLLAAALALSLTACGDSGSGDESKKPDAPSEALSASVEPEPTEEQKDDVAHEITYTNVRTYTDSIGTMWAQVIVEIENTGTSDLYLSSGSYDLEDESGKLIASNTMVSTYPEVISPGEKAYMYEEDMLDDAVEGNLTVVPRPSVEKAKVDNIRFNVSDVEISGDKYGHLKAMGRVENTTQEDQSMVYIVLILKDANGAPIGQIFTILTDDLPAGEKIGFEATAMSLPDDVTVDAIANYDVFAYPMQMQF